MKPDPFKQIRQQLIELEKKMLWQTRQRQALLKKIHPLQLPAANNLIHYLTLRNEDIRELQDTLHTLGLSSLSSSESHIHRQLQAILQRLDVQYPAKDLDTCTYDFNQVQMKQKSKLLFGEKKDTLSPFIMVTFDASFANNYALIKNLLQNGMNIARINCAHDDEPTWSKMIQHLKRACRYTNLTCKIYMDLAGPKIRTNLLCKGKEKGKVKIKEGELVWLSDNSTGFNNDKVVISPNEPGIIAMLRKGERIYIDDGIIKGFVESIKKDVAAMRIIRISSSKQQIKSGKGINFPDSDIAIASLTQFDKACLPFICANADMVGYSLCVRPRIWKVYKRLYKNYPITHHISLSK
jgi:pyruvate kinase